jgi:hypothetical protein
MTFRATPAGWPTKPRLPPPASPDDAQDELARLRGQVERLMQERVTPALAGAADQVSDYANPRAETIEDPAESLSETVRERPWWRSPSPWRRGTSSVG